MYTKEFENNLIEIFNEASGNNIPFANRGFCIPSIILEDSLLFLGINPSYSIKKQPADSFNVFYDYSQSGEEHSYYKKFAQISKRVNVGWSHLDMLYYQETAQSSYFTLQQSEEGRAFIEKQLGITKLILEKSRPKIIIVSNALSRELFLHNLSFNGSFDENFGTFRISEGALSGTPVFFTSMLTGKRALDNGSFERLVWHIEFVLRKIK